jgi:hypothetical protein
MSAPYRPAGDPVGPALAHYQGAIVAGRRAPSRKSARPSTLERVLAMERMVEALGQDLHVVAADMMRLGAELRALTQSVAMVERDVFDLRDRHP